MTMHAANPEHTHAIPCTVFRALLKLYFHITINPRNVDNAPLPARDAMLTIADYLNDVLEADRTQGHNPNATAAVKEFEAMDAYYNTPHGTGL